MTIREKTDKKAIYEVFLTYDYLIHAHYQIGNKLTLLFYPIFNSRISIASAIILYFTFIFNSNNIFPKLNAKVLKLSHKAKKPI